MNRGGGGGGSGGGELAGDSPLRDDSPVAAVTRPPPPRLRAAADSPLTSAPLVSDGGGGGSATAGLSDRLSGAPRCLSLTAYSSRDPRSSGVRYPIGLQPAYNRLTDYAYTGTVQSPVTTALVEYVGRYATPVQSILVQHTHYMYNWYLTSMK